MLKAGQRRAIFAPHQAAWIAVKIEAGPMGVTHIRAEAQTDGAIVDGDFAGDAIIGECHGAGRGTDQAGDIFMVIIERDGTVTGRTHMQNHRLLRLRIERRNLCEKNPFHSATPYPVGYLVVGSKATLQKSLHRDV